MQTWTVLWLSHEKRYIHFSKSLGTTELFRIVRFSVHYILLLPVNFHNNLKYASTSNIRENLSLYNLGDKSFKQTLDTTI